jgi:hypothetical protein
MERALRWPVRSSERSSATPSMERTPRNGGETYYAHFPAGTRSSCTGMRMRSTQSCSEVKSLTSVARTGLRFRSETTW